MQFLNYTETPLDFKKFKKNPMKSNLKSIWAFLLTAFIYISVFYVFNLSPATLLCTTKFWFIISNTLILIIATDFISFSSTKEHDSFYHDYGINNYVIPTHTTAVPNFEFQNVQIHEKSISKPLKEEVDHHEGPHEKILCIVAAHEDHSKNPETLEKDDGPKENPNKKNFQKNVQKRRQVKKREVKCARSNSDKAILTAAVAAENKGEKMVMRRTLSERYYEEPPPRLEENEFSKMSDEELNRRVEEFIRSFNRQIRLQAAMSRQNLTEIDPCLN